MPSPLEPEEMGSLMAAIGQAGQAAEKLGPAPVPVDLTNPERNIPEPMPALEAAHEQLSLQFARAVAGRTRRRFVIEPGRIVRTRGEELRDLMDPPSVIAVLDILGTAHQGLLLMDRTLAEALLAAGLGLAQGADIETADDMFTHLECLVLRRILSLIERPLRDAYRDITKLAVRVARIEPDPRLAEILGPTDVALMGSFTARGELEGSFRLALPFSVLERAKNELVRLPARKKQTPPPGLLNRMRAAVEHVKVAVDVDLGQQTAPMSEVVRLRSGDVLSLDTDENTPLAIRVNGMTKLWGAPTVSDGSLAVEVIHVAQQNVDPDAIPLGYAPAPASDGAGASLEMQGVSPAFAGAPMEDATPQEDDTAMTAPMPTPPAPSLDLDDVQVHITVRLGRTTLTIGEVMQMQSGSVVKLDKAAGEPLDVLVNGRLIGRGEAVVVGDRFGVRLTSVLEKEEFKGGQ